jgi:hypothetical protein
VTPHSEGASAPYWVMGDNDTWIMDDPNGGCGVFETPGWTARVVFGNRTYNFGPFATKEEAMGRAEAHLNYLKGVNLWLD